MERLIDGRHQDNQKLLELFKVMGTLIPLQVYPRVRGGACLGVVEGETWNTPTSGQ